ncbi:MAG: translocation/assembly module TamB [Rikenellaceae bacterium]|nr:translocation/assembly module TamB [Rikenellaceae bacterium]
MRKVIKISVHIVSALILALIILPVILMLAIQLPSVQNFAVRKATQWASGKLQTKVSIDRIDIKFFNRASVDGFYVEDYGGDTLLYARRLEADILNTGLMGGMLTFGNAKVSDVRFKMHEDEDGTSNFRKIIERIKRKNPPEERNPLPLMFTGVEVENFYYRMVRLEPRTDRGNAVNFTDVEVLRFDFIGSDVFIQGDSLHLNVDKMSFREKSGLFLSHFSARVDNLSGTGVDVKDVRLQSGRTNLKLASMRFESADWHSYKDFMEVIRLEGEIENSTIDIATIAAFTPKLEGMDYLVHDFRGQASGLVSDLQGSIPNISLYGTSLSFDFRMRGLPDISRAVFDVDLKSLETSALDIENILSAPLENPLPPRLVAVLGGMGAIRFHGAFNGSVNRFTSSGELDSDNTRAVFEFSMLPDGGGRAFTGNLGAYGVNAGELVGVSRLGRTGIRAAVNGTIGSEGLKGNADATVALLEYNGYRYRDIGIEGAFDNRRFAGTVTSTDENINFIFNGTLDFNDSVPRFDFGLGLHRADLVALNIARSDSVSVLKFDARAIARGSDPDNLNGVITISDLTYINDEDSVWTGRMELRGRNSEDSKYLSFTSYFADAEYRSRTGYSELFRELRRTLQSYLPALTPERESYERRLSGTRDADNYSLLSVNIKQANKAVGIFVPGLLLSQGSRLSLMFNPGVGQLSLSASSEFIEYNNNFVSNLEVNTRNEGDSLSLFVRADDMYAGRIYMPNFSVIGGLKENRINVSGRFVDSLRNMTALVGAASEIWREPQSGMVRAGIRFTPSSITIGERVWNIYSRGIEVDSARIEVNDFTIVGAGQNLTVDGVMSRYREDTLHVNFTNFDLEPLTNFTSRLGYDVAGRTNGHADLVAGRQDALLHASIGFDSIRLNGKPVPDGLFESRWDFQEERALFMLTRKSVADTVLRGYFEPSTGEYFGRATLGNMDISFIEPFFKGIVRDTYGNVDVEAEVSGQRRQLKVNGKAYIDRMGMTVDFLNVPYEIRDAVAEVRDNVITMDEVPVYDPYDNIAMFDMNVDLNNTQNINYNINVRPDNILAMNTDATYNDMFYGRVFGSGTVSVRGDRRGVNIDITASSGDGSEFYMPLSDYSLGISDIITFRERQSDRPEITDIMRRKMEIIRSRRRRARADEGQGNLTLNMNLNVQPNLQFRLIIDPRTGDMLTARGSGRLGIHFVPQADEFTMNGDYELTEGNYQFSLQGIINKRFTIEPGSRIVWFNEPLDAELNVSAVYSLKASLTPLLSNYNRVGGESFTSTVPVDCRIIMSGNLMEPEITFEVDVLNVDPVIRSIIANELSTQENVSTQFLSLLALNSFYNSGNGNIGSAGGSATAFDFLSSQLSNILSNDNIHIGVRYNQRSELTSDEVMLDFSTQLFGNRLLLDVEGNYNAQNTPRLTDRNASNLSGDFSLTWLIDRPGNLRLKGFSRTIDRFDSENQGLQESGLGIYYKEDFNVLGDIVRNFKERFSRREKRKARRAEMKGMVEALIDDEEIVVEVESPPVE